MPFSSNSFQLNDGLDSGNANAVFKRSLLRRSVVDSNIFVNAGLDDAGNCQRSLGMGVCSEGREVVDFSVCRTSVLKNLLPINTFSISGVASNSVL